MSGPRIPRAYDRQIAGETRNSCPLTQSGSVDGKYTRQASMHRGTGRPEWKFANARTMQPGASAAGARGLNETHFHLDRFIDPSRHPSSANKEPRETKASLRLSCAYILPTIKTTGLVYRGATQRITRARENFTEKRTRGQSPYWTVRPIQRSHLLGV